MENMLWIEEIAESKPAPQFLTNSRIDIAGFVNPHKVVVSGKCIFSCSSAPNTGESEEKQFFLKNMKKGNKTES
jgi:hypothetical protein